MIGWGGPLLSRCEAHPSQGVSREEEPQTQMFAFIPALLLCRLYHQAESMCKHYKTPILLIEFDPDRAFTLQVGVWGHTFP